MVVLVLEVFSIYWCESTHSFVEVGVTSVFLQLRESATLQTIAKQLERCSNEKK